MFDKFTQLKHGNLEMFKIKRQIQELKIYTVFRSLKPL